MKRTLDLVGSFLGLLVASPVLMTVMILVWLQDFKIPLYIAPRVGRFGQEFRMIKLRSMVVNADKSGVDSTSANDTRITPIGHAIRKFKLDELTQLWNVFIGDMSLVGPRPNVRSETELYTLAEEKLLSVRPGITDFSSIVFSDEGDILENMKNPDLAYNQLIRPWKSRLGLIYIDNQSVFLDLQLIFYTVIGIGSKKRSLSWVVSRIKKLNADQNLIDISGRQLELYPFPPPGTDNIVVER
jgi:lipopolysaccharide/colanic/teichoic acid biosynthesis glycosyltransferase